MDVQSQELGFNVVVEPLPELTSTGVKLKLPLIVDTAVAGFKTSEILEVDGALLLPPVAAVDRYEEEPQPERQTEEGTLKTAARKIMVEE